MLEAIRIYNEAISQKEQFFDTYWTDIRML